MTPAGLLPAGPRRPRPEDRLARRTPHPLAPPSPHHLARRLTIADRAPRQLFSLLAKCCSFACCMRSSCAIGHISAGTPQMMQGNFGKAIEPYGEDGGPDPNRGVTDHVVVLPQSRPQSPGQLCL